MLFIRHTAARQPQPLIGQSLHGLLCGCKMNWMPNASTVQWQILTFRWGGGGGGCGHLDPEIRGWGQSQKKFFRPFRPQFGLKIRKNPAWIRHCCHNNLCPLWLDAVLDQGD